MKEKELFDSVSFMASRYATQAYSTSFSMGIRCFDAWLRDPIYSIYGFVRFADEIVDTFHAFDKKALLERFREDTFRALQEKISLNPILNSFQLTVNKFSIDHALIEQFLISMEMDLQKKEYDQQTFETYILGSAEVVGLMCLKVFCKGDQGMYEKLKPSAQRLGSAFQKVNFLRDLNSDYVGLGRSYFPGVDINSLDNVGKAKIEASILADFEAGYSGIKQLPEGAKFGVYVAYLYYLALFKKIQSTPSHSVLRKRIRIENRKKASILFWSFLKYQLNLL